MKHLAIILFLFTSVSAQAASFASSEEAKQLIQNVMGDIKNDEVLKGVEKLKPYMTSPAAEFEVTIGKIKEQQPYISARYGKTIGVEFIKEELVGDSLMRITYIQKMEKFAFQWTFYLYKPYKGWVITQFLADHNLKELFQN